MNLAVLLLGIAGVVFARYHREQVAARYSRVLNEQARTPADTRKLKEELAELDLKGTELQRELQGRAKMLTSLKSEEFYLSVDTKDRKLRFYYGDTVLREADVALGENKTIQSKDGKTWTFVPVRGAFPIEAKYVGLDWVVPEWLYAMNNQPIPANRPTIPNGIGKYVIALPNGYVIHSPPSEDSPLKGPKPGSIMTNEADLAAIWPRIQRGKTPVYIY